MAAPTNITLADALDLGSTLPISTTQETSDSGTTYSPVYYKFTVPAGITLVGPWIYGNFGTWNPVMAFGRNVAGVFEQVGSSAVSVPGQFAVDPGETVYLKATKPGGNPSPAINNISVLEGPHVAAPAGAIAINDSNIGFPAIILSSSTGTNLNAVHPFASGENVRVLTSGLVLAEDQDANGVVLYDIAFNEQVVPTMPTAGYVVIGTDQTTGWWVGKPGGGGAISVVFVSQNGTVGSPTTFGTGNLRALTPSLNNTALYYLQNTSTVNQPIKKVVLSGPTVSNFVAADANYFWRQGITTLLDGKVVVGATRTGVANEIRIYDTAGTLLNTWPLDNADDQIEQLFTATDDPNSIWVWYQPNAEFSKFRNIKISDGSTLHEVTSTKFVQGVFQGSASSSPSARFGSDNSCVPWIVRAVVPPTPPTTTYPIRRQRRFLLPSSPDNKRVKIPTLELLMRTGIGLTPAAWNTEDNLPLGANPQVMFRISKDGGKTWSLERWRSAGQIGQYLKRVRLLQATGFYRNAVLEVTVSDPADWQFLSISGEPEEGAN